MTEQEYIYVGDLKSVSIALRVLRDIVTENNPIIDTGEMQKLISEEFSKHF